MATFLRCPKCRTLCDAGADPRCFACGASLPADAVHRPSVDHGSGRESIRDLSASRVIFAVVGAMGGLSFFLNLRGGLGLLIPLGFLIVAVIAGLLLGPRAAGQALLYALSGIGVVILILGAVAIGLLILLFIACTGGGMRIAG